MAKQAFILFFLFLGITLPYLKPILAPVSLDTYKDQWVQNVCLQSTPSSCGPASAATLLRMFDIKFSEKTIACECFTYRGGTENWYLARLFKKNGFKVKFISNHKYTNTIPIPSIAGVKVSGIGHFIPIMAETNELIITGDPLVGLQEWPKAELQKHFDFTGFFMWIKKDGEADTFR